MKTSRARLNAQHGKTYYFSTLFFPPEVRRSVHALYGFVRYPDEIVDNPPPGSDPAAPAGKTTARPPWTR